MDFNETRLLEVTLNPRVSIASVDGTQHLSEVVWSAFKIFTGKPTGKRPLGRPRRRWEDNIRMDLEIGRIGLIRLRIGIIGEPL